MPKVDGVDFPYTQAGMQKAKAWAAMTGKPMQMEKKYQGGGYAEFNPGDRPQTGKEAAREYVEENIEDVVNLAMGTVGGGGGSFWKMIKNIIKKPKKSTFKSATGRTTEAEGKQIAQAIKDFQKKQLSDAELSAKILKERAGFLKAGNKEDMIKQGGRELKESFADWNKSMREARNPEWGKLRPEDMVTFKDLAKKKGKKYKKGGRINPSSIEEVAHKPIESGTRQVVRYKAKTKGGEDRHIVRDIEGLTNEADKRALSSLMLMEAIRNNPNFADTVSAEQANRFMNPPSLWDRIKGVIPTYADGGEIPAGRRMYGTAKKKKKSLQTADVGPVRGMKKGGKVKMPKGWHV